MKRLFFCLTVILSIGASSWICIADPLNPPSPPVTDINALSLFRNGLAPDFALGYFDNEGNTPDSGEVRSTVHPETEQKGDKITHLLHFTFDMPAWEEGYEGWYISAKSGIINISDKTVLRFEVKGTPGIPLDAFQVGVLSRNLNPDANRAKVFLSELGYKTFPTQFAPIEIPISLLQKKEPNLDLSQASELIIFGIVSPAKDVHEQLWVKNVRWAWDVQKTDNGLLASLNNILFDFNKADIRPQDRVYLDRIVQVVKSYPSRPITVDGHTDNIGSAAYNLNLSRRRAQAVANYIIAHSGIKSKQVTVNGYGFDRPVASNETESGRARNRRVEVMIATPPAQNTGPTNPSLP